MIIREVAEQCRLGPDAGSCVGHLVIEAKEQTPCAMDAF